MSAPDVLVITVPIVGAYASTNDVGKIDRRKSPAYKDLFRNTREIARAEMARVGWLPATFNCDVSIVRYTPTLQRRDASNLGKAELDALSPSTAQQILRDRCEPFAGVWTNDELARPFHADVQYDPNGEDRIVVVIRRRFPDPPPKPAAEQRPENARKGPAQPRQRTQRTPPTYLTAIRPAAASHETATAHPRPAVIGDARPLINGRPVTHEEAMRELRKAR